MSSNPPEATRPTLHLQVRHLAVLHDAVHLAAKMLLIEFECFFAGTWKVEICADAGHGASLYLMVGIATCHMIAGPLRSSRVRSADFDNRLKSLSTIRDHCHGDP